MTFKPHNTAAAAKTEVIDAVTGFVFQEPWIVFTGGDTQKLNLHAIRAADVERIDIDRTS